MVAQRRSLTAAAPRHPHTPIGVVVAGDAPLPSRYLRHLAPPRRTRRWRNIESVTETER
jgi:hypothetical protein